MAHTRIQLWEVYVSKNPHWENDNITLTPTGLKKLFEQTYDIGYKNGVETTERKAKIEKATDAYTKGKNKDFNSENPFSDIFGDLFKK